MTACRTHPTQEVNSLVTVAIGLYVHVLRVLGLLDDLSLIAKEDLLGRRLQDESLPRRKRAPRRKPPTGEDDAKI